MCRKERVYTFPEAADIKRADRNRRLRKVAQLGAVIGSVALIATKSGDILDTVLFID